MYQQETGTSTPMLHTKRCDGCWELERRILSNPELARKILEDLLPTKDPHRCLFVSREINGERGLFCLYCDVPEKDTK